jgi:hypothetical protein
MRSQPIISTKECLLGGLLELAMVERHQAGPIRVTIAEVELQIGMKARPHDDR